MVYPPAIRVSLESATVATSNAEILKRISTWSVEPFLLLSAFFNPYDTVDGSELGLYNQFLLSHFGPWKKSLVRLAIGWVTSGYAEIFLMIYPTTSKRNMSSGEPNVWTHQQQYIDWTSHPSIQDTWNAKCPIFKAIVAGFRAKVALKMGHLAFQVVFFEIP